MSYYHPRRIFTTIACPFRGKLQGNELRARTGRWCSWGVRDVELPRHERSRLEDLDGKHIATWIGAVPGGSVGIFTNLEMDSHHIWGVLSGLQKWLVY